MSFRSFAPDRAQGITTKEFNETDMLVDIKDPKEQGDELSEEDIVERIFEAVIDQRLPPGSKLSESALCKAFGVGRMRVRRSLLLLASSEVVELQSNRGAFVASPTPKQALEVFEARMAIEPSVMRLAVSRATDADIEALRLHLDAEHQAHHFGKRREAIRLSGQFHVMLAQIAGNAVLLRMIKELVTRTSLIIGIFGAPGLGSCHDEDHQNIFGSFSAGDCGAAAALMVAHLEGIQASIDLTGVQGTAVDLVALFSRS